MDEIIKLDKVTKYFSAQGGVFKHGERFAAVDNVSLAVEKGRSLGLVGESGSGKTTVARMICDIYKADIGEIFYKNVPLSQLQKNYEDYRRNVQMIFQDPYNSLNPKLTIKSALSDVIARYKKYSKPDMLLKLEEVMDMVGLSYEFLSRYPHELSGGQRQRVSIARALILKPSLIIADEPVSSLDVSVQAQILNLMRRLKGEGVTFLLISHNLSLVSFLCEDIAVMKRGTLVEFGKTDEILSDPRSDYTKSLLDASLKFSLV